MLVPIMTKVPTMLRTTIYLREDTALALRHLSMADGRPQSELIREAIDKYIAAASAVQAPLLPPGAGKYKSGRGDVSSKAESLLRSRARKRR